jgi:hypothetical protein
MRSLVEPVVVAVGPFDLFVARDYPLAWDYYCEHARLVENDLEPTDDGGLFVLGIRAEPDDDHQLLVALRYSPSVGGFSPGVLIVPESGVAFVGAGTKLRAYRVGPAPALLWTDVADIGFWGWRRHGTTILMSAELELAAWDIGGQKLWTRYVEPPWSYTVEDDLVTVDVMGAVSHFGLRQPPANKP